MIDKLIPPLQPVVAQQLDRCSFYRLASSHRNLRHILDDPRSYIFNSTYRPRYVGELNDDLQSIGCLPSTEESITSTAFPPHLTSQASRKMYMSSVRSVDLRYCREGLVLAPEVPVLLSIVKNVTDLSLQGHWTYRLQEEFELNKSAALRELLLQLPLRSISIDGPVWMHDAGILKELNLPSFKSKPSIIDSKAVLKFCKEVFKNFPSLQQANDACFSISDIVDQYTEADGSISLQSLRLSACSDDKSVEAVTMLSLKSLHLDLPCDGEDNERTRLLFKPDTPMSQSLTSLDVSGCQDDVNIFDLAVRMPSLTSLRVGYRDSEPSFATFQSMVALTKANRCLQTLDMILPEHTMHVFDELLHQYFPIESAQESSFVGAAVKRWYRLPSTPSNHEKFKSHSFLLRPSFSSISILDLDHITLSCIDGYVASLDTIHTVKIRHVKCNSCPLKWVRAIAPNVRHLHLRDVRCDSAVFCSMFPDLLSLELQCFRFTDTDVVWLDNLARLPLRCIALGGVSPVNKDANEHIVTIGHWMHRILLDTTSSTLFADLRYVLFIPNVYTGVVNVKDVVPSLREFCAARPHLQVNICDTDSAEFVFDYDYYMQCCD